MSIKRQRPIWPQTRQGQQVPLPAGLGPRLCRGRIKQSASASTGQGEDAPTTQYAHNGLGQRVFKTEPLYSSTPASGSSNKNLNNLLADDDEPQAEPPGLIQQILNFFSKLWSPSTSDAEKLGFSYVYAEDGSLLGEYGSGGSNSSGTAQYIYLPTASGPMPIAAVIKGQTYAVHSDHLNTPRKLTQPDGQVAWQWAYSAFGDEQPTTGAKRFTSETTTPTTGATSIPEVTFNLRYPGQYFDKETKLHYNYFRTYAPSTGRYTQGDPIGLDGGWNRFGYSYQNPLKYTDPTGRVVPAAVAAFMANPACLAASVASVAAAAKAASETAKMCEPLWNNVKDWMFSGEGNEGQAKPPPDTLPIDGTPWSGDHTEIKGQSGAGAADNVRIGPSGEVWVQQPNGNWINTGNANDMIGGSEASGRRGKDREPPWKQDRGRKQRGDW